MVATVTVNDVLDGHVGLDIECLDRIYLNGDVPNLQMGGQVVSFLTQHLGNPIPSPAILEKIGSAFRRTVASFAEDNRIPVVRFNKADRKIDRMRPYLARQAATGRAGVAAIGVAQEFAPVLPATKRSGQTTGVWFSYPLSRRRVSCYYFYLWGADFGLAFVKVCAYLPYPMKIWVNGHEWAKRQALKAGLGFTELSNGFASAADPAALQAICDRLGPGAIRVFAERWWSILPLPHPWQEPLPTHRRRTTVCDLLHQSPRPAAAPPPRRRPTTHPVHSPKCITHHRHSHNTNHRPGSSPAKSKLKTQDTCQSSSGQASLEVRRVVRRRRRKRGRIPLDRRGLGARIVPRWG
jgi:hypothetical protein